MSHPLPEEQLRIYLNSPNRCPWCGGEVLSGRVEQDDDDNYARRSVYCCSCEREWNDVFRLVGLFVPQSREHHYLPETAPNFSRPGVLEAVS
jgi:formate dehydrogenase maturation protein FdhE